MARHGKRRRVQDEVKTSLPYAGKQQNLLGKGWDMPLERILLDTNIVCNLRWIFSDASFEDGFYDHYSQKFVTVGQELRHDCMALRFLINKDDQFALQFVISGNVLAELQQTQAAWKRDELVSIADVLATHFQEQQIEYLGESELPSLTAEEKMSWLNLYEKGGINFLPDDTDRRLIVDSVLQRCHIFMTVDRKTIWNYRSRLLELGVSVKRPLEYLRGFMFPLSPPNLGFLGPDDILNLINRV